MAILEIHAAAALQRLPSSQGVSPLDAAKFAREKPTLHLASCEGDRLLARASIWCEAGLTLDDHSVAAVGHYAATDAESGVAVLRAACERAAADQRTYAVGPMDGNTWRAYRLVTEPGTEPAFFMEPRNPPDWPEHFTGAGFGEIANYTSAVTEALTRGDRRLAAVAERMREQQVTIRPIALDRFEDELRSLHTLCLAGFRRNFLYAPIDGDAFVDLYLPVRPHIQPELVLIAERGGEAVGFVFAVPDLAQAERGEPIDQVVVKTVAIAPGRSLAGLGHLLVQQVQEAAHRLGYRRAIHALMHEGNSSRGISARYAHVFRRYALFGCELAR